MFKNYQKGVSLYLALIIMFILLAIGLGISLIIVSQMKMIRGMGDSVVAFYAGDTGIEHSLYKTRIEGDLTGEIDPPEQVGDAYYKVTKVTGEDIWQSVGTFQGVKRAIEISAPPPVVSITPTVDGYVWYDTVPDPDERGRNTTADTIDTGYLVVVGLANLKERGFIEWDISSPIIPVGATINSVTLKYHGAQHDIDAHIHHMANQPSVTASDTTLYDDCGDGTVYADVAGFPVVAPQQEIDLGLDAVSDIQAKVNAGVDWFAIGIEVDGYSNGKYAKIYSKEYASAEPAPILYVKFTP